MAINIPTQNTPNVAPIVSQPDDYQRVNATPTEFGANIGEAEQKLGGALSQAGDTLAKHALVMQGLRNETTARDANTEYVRQASDLWSSYSQKEGKDAVDAYPQFQRSLGDLMLKMRGTLPNEQAQKLFTDATTRYVNYLTISGSRYAADQNKKWMLQSHKARQDAMIDSATLFRNDPDTAIKQVNTGLSEVLGEGELRGWGKDALADAQANYAGKAYRTVVDALAQDDVAKAQQFYDKVKDKIPGTYQVAIEQDLKRTHDASSAAFRGDVDRRFNDSFSALEDGKTAPFEPSATEIRAAYPKDPQKADYMIRQLDRAARVGQAKSNMGMTSIADDNATLKALEPDSTHQDYTAQIAGYNAVVTAYNAKVTALAKDPADYVIGNSPKVAALWKSTAQNPQAAPAYISSIDAAYDKIGVPQAARRYLPNATADAMVQHILAQPADQRANTIVSLQQKYGDSFDRIMGDLVHAKLPAVYEVLAAVDNPAARTALADAIGGGKEKTRGALRDDDAKEIDREIDTDENLAALKKSFASRAGGLQKAAEITTAVKMMAYRFALNMDPQQAAQRAVASVTTDKYDFMDDGARVPKGTLSDVRAATGKAIADLKPDEVANPFYLQPKPSSDPLTGITEDTMTYRDAYTRNKPFVKEGATSFNTKLSPEDEAKFQEWVRSNNVPFDVNASVSDYDMRGFWKALEAGDPKAKRAIDPNDHQMHFPDYWKTPYDATFSNQSKFATADAPHWTDDDKLVSSDGKVIFDDRAPRKLVGEAAQIDRDRPTKETRDAAKMRVVQGGRWVTNERDDGLVRLDSNGYPVMLSNGKRLEIPFSAMKGAGDGAAQVDEIPGIPNAQF